MGTHKPRVQTLYDAQTCLTVGDLRRIIAGLSDDIPVASLDSEAIDPLCVHIVRVEDGVLTLG
jgi:hypothetical protein